VTEVGSRKTEAGSKKTEVGKKISFVVLCAFSVLFVVKKEMEVGSWKFEDQ
jgi:hypothetical protein